MGALLGRVQRSADTSLHDSSSHTLTDGLLRCLCLLFPLCSQPPLAALWSGSSILGLLAPLLSAASPPPLTCSPARPDSPISAFDMAQQSQPEQPQPQVSSPVMPRRIDLSRFHPKRSFDEGETQSRQRPASAAAARLARRPRAQGPAGAAAHDEDRPARPGRRRQARLHRADEQTQNCLCMRGGEAERWISVYTPSYLSYVGMDETGLLLLGWSHDDCWLSWHQTACTVCTGSVIE